MHDKTFYRVTNHEVYCKLLEIEMLVKKTNGKVKLNRWIATTALSLCFLILGLLISHL